MIEQPIRVWFCASNDIKQSFFIAMQNMGLVEFDIGQLKDDFDSVSLNYLYKRFVDINVQPIRSDCICVSGKLSVARKMFEEYDKVLSELEECNNKLKKYYHFSDTKWLSLWQFCSDSNIRLVGIECDSSLVVPDSILVAMNGKTSFRLAIDLDEEQFVCEQVELSEDIFLLKETTDHLARRSHSLLLALSDMGKTMFLISKHIVDIENLKFRQQSVMGCKSVEDIMFVSQGWCSKSAFVDVERACICLGVYCGVSSEIERDLLAPTIFDNDGYSRIGQDLVEIYDTPSASDKDPSLWVLASFSLFFAMIVCDAGYGALMLLVSYYMQKRNMVPQRVVRLLYTLSICTIVVGILFGSAFAISFSPDSVFRSFSILDVAAFKKLEYCRLCADGTWMDLVNKFPAINSIKSSKDVFSYVSGGSYPVAQYFTDSVCKEICLSVGVLHICTGMFRYVDRAPIWICWMFAMVSSYFMLANFLGVVTLFTYIFGIDTDVLGLYSYWVLIGSISIAQIMAIMDRRLNGLLEVTNAIQIFSDVLSYLRIYALALSGAMVSATCNELAFKCGVVFAVPIILVGHSINILLSVMGGFVHGLRLNFLEWYHYSFEGGGRPFSPLRFYGNKK